MIKEYIFLVHLHNLMFDSEDDSINDERSASESNDFDVVENKHEK